MIDVTEGWKEQRFIIVEAAMIDITDGNLVVLTDIAYWNERYDHLIEWCREYNAEVRGMTVTCDDHTLTAFCLRWA